MKKYQIKIVSQISGTSDQVRCFHCDGGLRHWDPEDDPWTEHARWFSVCGYVRLVKGDDFIQQAIAQRPPVLPTEVCTMLFNLFNFNSKKHLKIIHHHCKISLWCAVQHEAAKILPSIPIVVGRLD